MMMVMVMLLCCKMLLLTDNYFFLLYVWCTVLVQYTGLDDVMMDFLRDRYSCETTISYP